MVKLDFYFFTGGVNHLTENALITRHHVTDLFNQYFYYLNTLKLDNNGENLTSIYGKKYIVEKYKNYY